MPYLARLVPVVCDAVFLEGIHSAVIWVVANMVRAGAAAIDLVDAVQIGRLGGDGSEDALCHGRAADVAEADEKYRYGFLHGCWMGCFGARGDGKATKSCDAIPAARVGVGEVWLPSAPRR